ncbi:hypothetical protein [Phytohabitans flavus]|nr:hypothetical protein [Phytohabitans flavus]
MTEQSYTPGDVPPAQPRRSRTPLVLLVVAVAVLSAGGGAGGAVLLLADDNDGSTPAAAAAGPSTSAPAPAPTTAPAPGPSSPPAPTSYRFGQKASDDAATVDATVLSYKQPVATGVPKPDQPGAVWGAAQVQVCARAQDVGVSRFPWKLAYADGGVVEPSGTGYEGFPTPEYPWEEHALAPGRCAKGWIVFPVPPGQRPVFVQYHPQDNRLPVEWRVA